MKKPKLSNLKFNLTETNKIRKAMANQKSVKITINIDAATLSGFKAIAEETGIPYQRLINKSLSESLVADAVAQSRLEKIEKELTALKKKIAA